MVDRHGGGRPALSTDDRLAATLDKENDVVNSGMASINQLNKMFRTTTAGRHLSGVRPAATRRGVALYDIAEAATMLVKPGYEIEDRIRHMNQADLPPLLGKEFWNGQRAREAFEDQSGNRWHTDDVIAVFAETFAEARMVFLLALDNVERQTGVTTQQRDIFKRLIEGGISSMKERLMNLDKRMPMDNIAGEKPLEL